MKPSYVALTFDIKGYDPDVWMALLGEWPFDSFHEEENQITAYLRQDHVTHALLKWVEGQRGERFHRYSMEDVPEQNWNEVWEHSFHPVEVKHYCYIRAEFHPEAPPGFTHEILIAPKMAFGTGHHATTWMMIDAMSHLAFAEKEVLDFGCGTGILSILAAREGARLVTGIDIQPEAIENSIEHATLNQVVDRCQFILGDLDLVDGHIYDIILANINTHVIAASLGRLKQMLRPGGYLLLSGMMVFDDAFIREQMDFSPWKAISRQERGEWIQMTMQLPDHV